MKLLAPKKFKYKKSHNIFYKANSYIKFKFLTYYTKFIIFAINSGYLTAKHLETFRLYLRRILKTGTNLKVSISTFPDLSRTKKSAGLRMGKGKGKPYVWVSKLKRGSSIFEIKNNFSFLNFDNEFYNIPLEFETSFKQKSLRHENPFVERNELDYFFPEFLKIPLRTELDFKSVSYYFTASDDFVFNYFLRLNSVYAIRLLVNLYSYSNYVYGAYSNDRFFLRDSLYLEKLFKGGLKKFPIKSSFMKLHNKFFLYN
jgi:large subunit ribosomal protein L16